jgi:aminoglycoside phosphotransferase (APT) family kinase protein
MSVQGRLKRYYREFLGDPDVQLINFYAHGGGWETEVYQFAEGHHRVFKSCVLRMYPGANAVEKCEREFRGMRQLFELGYPVPEVFEHSIDPKWLGKPFITMKYIKHGQSLGTWIYWFRHYEFITRFAQLLVDLHRIDYRPFLWLVPDEVIDPSSLLQRKFSGGRRLIVEQFQQEWAIPVFGWLEAGLPDVLKTASLSVIHNDFHPWNIMYFEGKAYVIDWSLIEVADYRFDLGWTLILAARRSLTERALILSEYERLAGHPVEQIEYFEVIAALRRLFDVAASLTSGAESLGMRPETVEIMRQQGERYRRVYAILQKHTGLILPEIERLISSLTG